MTVWIDENLPPRLAKCLNELVEYEVKYIPSVFGKGSKDYEWIPKVAGSYVITADFKMRLVSFERPLIEKYDIGLFVIKPSAKKGWNFWEQIKLVVDCWESIDKAIRRERRPFVFKLLRKGEKVKDKSKRKYRCLEAL